MPTTDEIMRETEDVRQKEHDERVANLPTPPWESQSSGDHSYGDEAAHWLGVDSPVSATATPGGFTDSEHFPLMLAAAEVLFGTIFDWFTTSPEEELAEEQLDYVQKNRLRASGVFSDEDIAQIEAGAGPMVNRVAGNLASRGIKVDGCRSRNSLLPPQAAPFHKLQAQCRPTLSGFP